MVASVFKINTIPIKRKKGTPCLLLKRPLINVSFGTHTQRKTFMTKLRFIYPNGKIN